MSDDPIFVSGLIYPQGLVIDNTGTYMYIVCNNNGNGIINKINISLASIVTDYKCSNLGNVFGLAIDNNGIYMYVTSVSNSSIIQIEVSTGTVIKNTWQTKALLVPFGITIDNSGTYMYVTTVDNNNIAQIDMLNGNVITDLWVKINVLNSPQSLIIDNTGTYMYVANKFGYITQISINNDKSGSVNKNWISGLIDPVGLAIDNNGTYMYVTNQGNATISQISIESGIITVPNWVTESNSSSYPSFLTIYNNYLYVSNAYIGAIGNICKYQLTNTSSSVNVGTSYKGESCYNFLTPNGLYGIQFRFAQTKKNTITNYINIFKIIDEFIIFKNYVEIDIHIQNNKIDELIQQNTFLNLKNNTNAKYITKFYRKVSHALLKTLPKSKRGFCMLEPIQFAP